MRFLRIGIKPLGTRKWPQNSQQGRLEGCFGCTNPVNSLFSSFALVRVGGAGRIKKGDVMAKGRMYFWLSKASRYKEYSDASYKLWAKKPRIDVNNEFHVCGPYFLRSFCPELFEKYFPKLKLKPGECRRIRIDVEFV